MVASPVSFLTPYWSGAEMMRIHLESVRRFHPDAPILVSKRGRGRADDREDMAACRRQFGIDYWLEDCGYTDAYLRLLQRCRTRYACFIDHDAVLLSSVDGQLADLAAGRYDLVGIEERIRLPEHVALDPWPGSNGWLRFAPGCTASNFLIFDWQAFERRWGLRGIFGTPVPGARHFDFDYGIGQRLVRHHYLRPFHVRRYGIGNLLKDGDTAVAWHQWYGSYRTRLADAPAAGEREIYPLAEAGERAFIADYPNLVLAEPSPAWGPELDIEAEQRQITSSPRLSLRRRMSHGYRALAARIRVGLERPQSR